MELPGERGADQDPARRARGEDPGIAVDRECERDDQTEREERNDRLRLGMRRRRQGD